MALPPILPIGLSLSLTAAIVGQMQRYDKDDDCCLIEQVCH
ncbi:hypothetical protein [Nodosilinea sp. P-1105]|nr:hypothetical protein [Nodosilinea sp. P-1105]